MAGVAPEALPGLAAEVVALRPDLIIAPGTATIRAVRDATPSIQIVMASGGDPVGSGLVTSLARPSGNITGNRGASIEARKISRGLIGTEGTPPS